MRDTPDAVMLYAAGFGTRMAPLTDTMPKPLIAVGGRALIDHALALCDGVARRVVNLHYRGAMIETHLAGHDVELSWERGQILDTGGGLLAALPLLGDGPVFTLNTDAVWTGPNPLATLRAAWSPGRMDALLLTLPSARAKGRGGAGDFTLAQDGRLTRGGDFVYTGAQIIRTDRLAEMGKEAFSLNEIWNSFAAVGRLFGAIHPGGWCDVGHPGGIAIAEAMLGRGDV